MNDIWYWDEPNYKSPCTCGHRRTRKQMVSETVGPKITAYYRLTCERCDYKEESPGFAAAFNRYWERNAPQPVGLPRYGEPYRNSAGEPFDPQPLVEWDEAEFTLPDGWKSRVVYFGAPREPNAAFFKLPDEPEADAPTVVEG